MTVVTGRLARLLAVGLAFACLTAGIVTIESGRTRADAAAVEADELERLLPPGVQQVLSAFRVFEGFSARNSVYREADAVQRDLRDYYDARIATAQRQLVEREQLGLRESQVRAYMRVHAQLEAERAAAIAVTEFEKKVAKYGFESAFRTELLSALARVPRVREGLDRMRETVGELQTAVRSAQDAIRTGNPIAAAATEVREAADKLERFGAVAGVISGDAGRSIATAAATARSAVAPVTDALDGADDAAEDVIDQLDGLVDAIDEQTGTERSPRGGLDVPPDEGSVIGEILTPTGDNPEADAIAAVIGRQATERARDRGQPTDDSTMRDRVRAEVLERTVDRIAEACGRIVGAARRAQLDAAAAGAPLPWTRRDCTTYDNPDELDELIDEVRSGLDEQVDAAADETPTTEGTADEADEETTGEGAAGEEEDEDEGDEDEEPVRRVFRGPGSMTSIWDIECSTDLDYELVLNPDLTATLFLSAIISSTRNSDGEPICQPGDPQLYSGSWEPIADGATATIAIGSSEFTMQAVVEDREDGPSQASLSGAYVQPSRVSSAPDKSGTFTFTDISEIEP